jgi:hypothetical protein
MRRKRDLTEGFKLPDEFSTEYKSEIALHTLISQTDFCFAQRLEESWRGSLVGSSQATTSVKAYDLSSDAIRFFAKSLAIHCISDCTLVANAGP